MMRKDILIHAAVDRRSAFFLLEIAARESEGNRSAALRKIIREAAAARGLRADVERGDA